MSKSGKKVGRRMNGQRFSAADIGDVTLNDFANSSVSSTTGRLKKNYINKVVSEVKQLNLVEDSRSWDEKLDDLEFVAKDEKKGNTTEIKKVNSHRKKKISTKEIADNQTGYDYPIEIWFLISDHIRPEDVGTFAAICKSCLAVVSTAKFWFSLYKRYYRKVANLPERLQPECMVRKYGLRAYVIRALHFMYPPFINKLKPQVIFDGDPHILTKSQCVLSWSQKKKNQWLFYFKLRQSGVIKHGRSDNETNIKPSLLEMLEDITANLDNNCKVLQVTCLNYTPLPMISGQILSGVSLTLSQGMRYHRLQLNFDCGPLPYMNSNPIVLDPVINVRILDWWHPKFPHSDGLNSLCWNETSSPFDELEF